MAMKSIESGSHDNFTAVLKDTGNTVCGRHPIGVLMAAIEVLSTEGKVDEGKGKFKFVRYERSSDCISVDDSSVSYASAFAVI
jgi:AmmeMemoRadiSam system protein B